MNRFLIILLTVFAYNIYALPSVYLKKKLVTELKTINLSDVATLDKSVADTILIKDLEKPVHLSAAEIAARVKGSSPENIYGDGVTVIPLNGILTGDRAGELLTAELKSKDILRDNNYKITCEDERKLVYPDFANITMEWGSLPSVPNSGLRMLILKFMMDGEIIHSLRIKFLFQQRITAVVPTRYIKRGERFAKEDWERVTIYSVENEKNFYNSDITGFTALTDLDPDKIIHIRQIRNSKPVEKGAKIDTVYVGRSVVVKSNANAMQSGEIGDLVKLKKGSKILSGRISGNGIVTIE